MSSDIFAGNQNNVAKSISKIWAGSKNNIAMPVKGVFIGDSNNVARKVWPNSILPSSYQQLEWIDIKNTRRSYGYYGGIYITTVSSYFPRISISFTINYYEAFGGYGPQLYSIHYSSESQPHYSNCCWIFSNYLMFDYYRTNEEGYITYNYINEVKTNTSEGLLSNTRYTVDANHVVGSNLNYYVYNTEGFYSISSNNLVASCENQTRQYTQFEGVSIMGVPSNSSIRYYHASFYNPSNELINDLYTCQRKSDNKYGLYDYVNRIFYPFSKDEYTTLIPGPTV